jgi:endo-alpha-1,4-polygalactosaminidase (GH114 family)
MRASPLHRPRQLLLLLPVLFALSSPAQTPVATVPVRDRAVEEVRPQRIPEPRHPGPALAPPPCRSRRLGGLNNVTSFEYVIANNFGVPGISTAIANSPSDLVILGGGSYQLSIDRSAADPKRNKLIFGYIDVAEAASYEEPDLFSGSSLPSWFGNANPCCAGLYSVQFWNPAWEPEILALVDDLIADGYDGVFLDVLTGGEWSEGNSLGNPTYANATQAMATLLSRIRAHVNTKTQRPFYLIGNNPSDIGAEFPDSLKNLDAIFNEWVYYGQIGANQTTTSTYEGTASAAYIANYLAPIYDAADVPVFGNDYPLPLADPTADIKSFGFYAQQGWIPSVTTALQTDKILSTGPFMFAATAANPTVTGSRSAVNYLAGGCATEATLIGGDQGDYFIGGPGRNTIAAGAGDDTIYAHPASAGFKNVTRFVIGEETLSSTSAFTFCHCAIF